MTAASQPQLVTLRSGAVVRIRQVRPDDAPALVRAYATLGEQSRYRAVAGEHRAQDVATRSPDP